MDEEQRRQKDRENYLQSQVNQLWKTIPNKEHHHEPQERAFSGGAAEKTFYILLKKMPPC